MISLPIELGYGGERNLFLVTSQVLGRQNVIVYFKTEGVIMCCLVKAIAHLRGGDKLVWSNCSTVINTGKIKKLADKNASLPMHSAEI
jgi:hypothetical protein